MFKLIKEFFVGKPKVEEPVVVTTEPAVTVTIDTVVVAQPAVEEIKPEPVVISVSDNMNMSFNTQSDTIILPPVEDTNAWPFPKVVPAESEAKKKRTPVKREEPVTKKKPIPAITANNKPRKKK